MTDWILLSRDGQDEYINLFAQGAQTEITDTRDFCYAHSNRPIVLRGIMKHKIMKQCWQDQRRFYYMDTGYLGNTAYAKNPQGWKLWHRIVSNDLQHSEIKCRPADRWLRLGLELEPRRRGRRIIVAAPDEKPCRFYGINQEQWISHTLATLTKFTDRPIVLRHRVANRNQRMIQDPLCTMLRDDVHALVTFNSNAAVESIMAGVPAFVLAPTHAARPVANLDLAYINSPEWPSDDKLHAWVSHLAYAQFHRDELSDGTAYRILNED